MTSLMPEIIFIHRSLVPHPVISLKTPRTQEREDIPLASIQVCTNSAVGSLNKAHEL
jgi:hypothetical protein